MTTAGAPGSPRIQMVRGAYFTYAMPEGWKLGEEGPYALSLASSEGNAGIIVTGISGLLYPLSPEQFMTCLLYTSDAADE